LNFAKVLFLGLGGAGQRHLRIFKKLLPDNTIFSTYRSKAKTPLLNENFTVNNQNTIESAYNLKTFRNLELAFADEPDLTVISTPTSLHKSLMMMAIDAKSGVFVEKPWAESSVGFLEFHDDLLRKNLPFHISFQRRFHPQIIHIRQALISGAIGKIVTANFTVFSHVPSWHRYEDWQQLYAVRSEMGGGVLLTEIHEIDLANWFFGLPDKVFCTGGNLCLEKLKVEDTVNLTLLYQNFSVQLTLCFMHKAPSRHIHLTGTKGDICWDGNINSLKISLFDGSLEVNNTLNLSAEAAFVAQAEKFLFDWSLEDTIESLSAAANSLKIVEAAKRSMKSGKVESIRNYNN
jgi:predicted dehydrogenase